MLTYKIRYQSEMNCEKAFVMLNGVKHTKKGYTRKGISFFFILCKKQYYFFPSSNCCFNAAKASMSPKVVEAA